MKSKNKKYKVKTLDKIAKETNPLFRVWYHKNDGWWIETEANSIFIGCDSNGAYNSILNKTYESD